VRDVRDAFLEDGYVRVPHAFTAEEAAAMRDAVWCELARRYGIDRDDRSTWRVEVPHHLQALKKYPAFAAIESDVTGAALDDVLGPGWIRPKNWGALFLTFPVPGAVPDVSLGSWHIDAPYDTSVAPPFGARVLALFGDVEPGAGGMNLVEGSHRVLAAFAERQPAEILAKNARARRAFVRSHPWLAGLHRPDEAPARIRRFMHDGATIDGVRVRVVEVSGCAGDVFLMHPGVLHARPVNAGTAPRFMTSGFVSALM
jgi:Phytanoyl-CoA dioxygenase (PhyH)